VHRYDAAGPNYPGKLVGLMQGLGTIDNNLRIAAVLAMVGGAVHVDFP
jgi:hypothetical protein